jgi:chromosomal replication initiation ATPase DnaA
MQFEPVKTQYQPKTAAEVIATARLVKQRQMHRDADVIRRHRAEIEAQAKVQREAEAARKAQEDADKRNARQERINAARRAVYLASVRGEEDLGSVSAVVMAASLHFGVSRADITSDRRTSDIIYPRHVAMYVAKICTKRSLPYIGAHFGNRDHSTVINAVKKLSRLLDAGDERAASDVAAIKRAMGLS